MEKEITERQFAVVTGASSGIGYELAKQFAKNGFDLLVTAEDKGIFEIVSILEDAGAKVSVHQADLAKREGVESLYQAIRNENRDVDAIAINAGVGVGGDFVRETDLEAELNLINLNVISSVHLAKLVLKDMVRAGKGRVLFSSSIAATMPGTFEAIYGASKAFIQSFALAVRNEIKDTGVTITSLMPGPTETEFFHRAGMDDTRVGVSEKDHPEDVAKDGFEALMAGKEYVVAGSLTNKILTAANKVVPESAKAAFHRVLSEPGSGKSH